MAVDPLSVLRHYIINRIKIIESENHFRFHEFAFEKNVQTNFFYLVVKGSSMKVLVKQYYTLECVVFLLKNVHLRHPEYVQKALAQKIPIVRRRDRKVILAYLYGMIRSSNRIDKKDELKSVPSLVDRAIKDEPGTCSVLDIPTKEEINIQLVRIEREGQQQQEVTTGQQQRCTVKVDKMTGTVANRHRSMKLSDVLTAKHIEEIKEKFQRAKIARKQHKINKKSNRYSSLLTM